MPSAPERPSPSFRAPAVIFWAAFGLRLAVILLGRTYHQRLADDHFDFGFEAGRIARSLVTGHGYGNPFNGFSGPTAWLPPLYPLLLALAFRVFGVYTNGAAIFILALNSLFSALVVPAVYEIAARCFDARGIARRASRHATPVALWSAWLWAVYPAALQYAVKWVWEMSLTVCLFSWALVLALRLRGVGEERTGEPHAGTLAQWSAFGVLWGLIALSNASLLLMLPASILWTLWPHLRRRRQTELLGRQIAGATLACALFAAVLAPWVARNERTLHAFIPTRANFGVELWQSSLFWHDALPWGGAMPMWSGDPEFRHYAALGEVAYAREKTALAKRNLHARPDLFLKFTAERVQFFWAGTPHPESAGWAGELFRQLNYSIISVAGLLGLGLALRRRVPGAGLLGLAMLLVPAVYYAVTVQPRFRHPLEPLLGVLAVYLFRSTEPRRARA